MKISLDKYYTDKETVDICLNELSKLQLHVTGFLEPSAGAGAFSLRLENCLAYDIEPEHESILKQDFLQLDLEYVQGRCVIGNPPFGTRNTLSVKFFKKAITLGDYIAFILPISQHENNQQMYEFDLIHSIILPETYYSGIQVNTCFNVYKRPSAGIHTSPRDWRLQDVLITEYRRGGSYPLPKDYDYGMCTFGTIGKEVKYPGEFCQENYFYIKNLLLRDSILSLLRTTNWKNLYKSTTTNKIQTWKLYKYLKLNIEGIV
jgi:hypothetical protein